MIDSKKFKQVLQNRKNIILMIETIILCGQVRLNLNVEI